MPFLRPSCVVNNNTELSLSGLLYQPQPMANSRRSEMGDEPICLCEGVPAKTAVGTHRT